MLNPPPFHLKDKKQKEREIWNQQNFFFCLGPCFVVWVEDVFVFESPPPPRSDPRSLNLSVMPPREMDDKLQLIPMLANLRPQESVVLKEEQLE